MSKIINNTEIEQFKKDGAVLIKGKFDNPWIEKLKIGIKKGTLYIFVSSKPELIKSK